MTESSDLAELRFCKASEPDTPLLPCYADSEYLVRFRCEAGHRQFFGMCSHHKAKLEEPPGTAVLCTSCEPDLTKPSVLMWFEEAVAWSEAQSWLQALADEAALDGLDFDPQPEQITEDVVRGLIPYVAAFITQDWDWRPHRTEAPAAPLADGGPKAHPPGWLSDEAWTVSYEGAYPWAIDFSREACVTDGPLKDFLDHHHLLIECHSGYAVSVHLRGEDDPRLK